MLVLAAAPYLVRRFVEPAASPRALVWVNAALLVTVALAIAGISVFLILFLAPRSLMGSLGAVCLHQAYCPHALPLWAQFGLWIIVVALLAWLAGRVAWTGTMAFRAGRKIRRAALAAGVPVDAAIAHPVWEVADDRVFACTLGTWRPLVLVSSGLRSSISPQEFAVVLAHEEAHARSRDNLLLLIARSIDKAFFFFPGVERAYQAVRRQVEVAADAAASSSLGDRLLVASSVTRVARLAFASRGGRALAARTVAAGFAHGELVVERVQRLIDDSKQVASRRRLLSTVALFATILVVFSTGLYAVTGDNLVTDSRASVCVTDTSR